MVRFEGTGTDANGSIVKYEWDADGNGTYEFNSATSGVYTHTYSTPGVYTATLGVTDSEALAAFHQLAACEGIVPALESAHAVAGALKLARRFARAARLPRSAWRKKLGEAILVGLSGRGDKDMETARRRFPELG